VQHRTCSEPGCGSTNYYALGYCARCYARHRRAGLKAPPKVYWQPDENGCWIWTGPTDTKGYGQAPAGKRGLHKRAHRFVWEQERGPIPKGLELDHLCRVKLCVNPDHLEPVTHRENMRRSHSWAGENARKTHCKRGHEFTPENIYWNSGGTRTCRRCTRRRLEEAA